MDQPNLLLPSLNYAMYLEKALSRRLSQPPIGLPPVFLASTGLTKASITESSLMLDFLAAESALEDYRTAKIEELARRTSLAHTRESLRSSLAVPGIPDATQASQYLAEPCDVPVRTIAVSAVMPTGKASRKQLRCSRGSRTSKHHSIQRRVDEKSRAAPPAKPRQPTVPTPRRKKSKCWDSSISFPSKLFNMLEEAETEGHSDIISFTPDGMSFMIYKPDELAQDILPKYFRTSRLSSLQKQLSLYGFKRIRKGPNLGAMRHEFFQRDSKRLAAKITRKRQAIPKGEPFHQQITRTEAQRALNETV